MRVLLLGASGHLGTALRGSCPAQVEIESMHFSRPFAGSRPFNLADPAFGRSDVVIGAFPFARSRETLDPKAFDDDTARYLDTVGRARLVQLSSDAVYRGDAGPYAEDAPADAGTAYGRAQATLDTAITAARPDALVIRTSFIFGFAGSEPDKRLAPYVQGTLAPAEQRWPANVMRSPTEVNFLAHAIWLAVEREIGGVLNVAGPSRTLWSFFVAALSRLIAFRPPPAGDETRPGIARNTALTTDRMTQLLGMEADETWQWYDRYRPQAKEIFLTAGLSSPPCPTCRANCTAATAS